MKRLVHGMEFLDSRRLTGPNLISARPGAVVDIRCTAAEADTLIECWEKYLRQIFDALDWQPPAAEHRRCEGGVSLYFPAPIDLLYAASGIGEWAWAMSNGALSGADIPDFATTLKETIEAIAEEANPQLVALERAADQHGRPFLWDDDQVSLGHGVSSQVWPARMLPVPEALDWESYREIPLALVTGTNGKTTTVRLAAHILRGADRTVGLSSTEWIAVNDRVVDRGDWSGPGGARVVLRQPDVEVAILETARGGLLRRGLGVHRATAALITNVAEDHLGDFGSRNLDELLDIKWIVSRAVEQDGTLILNADDPLLVRRSGEFGGRIDWFSLRNDHPLIVRHTAAGGRAVVLDDDELVQIEDGRRTVLCRSSQIPITLGGAARHNIANALSAAALTGRMGATTEQIRSGLTSMSPDRNPGRSNLYDVDGLRVLVDFAHNPHAMQALFDMAKSLPAKRRALCFGQAGDRTDGQIRDLARNAWKIGLELVVISELSVYARGRAPGEVHAILRDELKKCGAKERQILHFADESESLDAALQWAQPGDLIIMLALGGSAPVHAQLTALGAR